MPPTDSNGLPNDVVTKQEISFRSIAVFALISLLVVIPCLWHRRIEAGDLASHVYNAWLAHLIEKGQAPGLYLSQQTHNLLFDLSLFYCAKIFGLAAAQKVAVSVFVLVFFWGVFALIRAVTAKPPWFLTPCLAMLAYGYSFEMGFVNYYVSIGLACLGLAVFWRPQGREWIAGLLLIPVTWLAHPIGFFWLIGTLAYIKIRAKLPGWWKLALPSAAACAIFAVCWYAVAHRTKFLVDWDRGPFYLYNGADQLALFGHRYLVLAVAAFLIGALCVVSDVYMRRKEEGYWRTFELPFELYLVTFFATSLLPENLRLSMYAGWIGVLSSRLTTISAILGVCILGLLKPRKWHFAGFTVCAACFFTFLFQDTAWINRLETNAEKLVENLPAGTRVLVSIDAPVGSRITFVGHSVERACIGHCFSYANYEPASGEFRVRVQKGSPVVTASTDDAEDMASGEYEVDEADLPLMQIYQCDAKDLTRLCIRGLKAGETNGTIAPAPRTP